MSKGDHIILTCDFCKQQFKRMIYRYRINQRNGAINFYCSQKCGGEYRRQEFENKFWERVHKEQGPKGECWIIKTKEGSILRSTSHKGRQFPIHRLAYLIANGWPELLTEDFIRHSCDFRNCVNPDHLTIGSHLDNMHDMRDRSRSSKGSHNPQSKLTEAQVLEIKQLLQQHKMSKAKIAAQFGISSSSIKNIASGRTWQHVGGLQINVVKSLQLTPEVDTKLRNDLHKYGLSMNEYIHKLILEA